MNSTPALNHRTTDRSRVAAFWGRWGRDLWLLVISALVLWTAIATQQLVNDQKEGRRLAITTACEADQAIADVMRVILLQAADTRMERAFFDRALEPLGGLERLSPAGQAAQCAERVRRANATP